MAAHEDRKPDLRNGLALVRRLVERRQKGQTSPMDFSTFFRSYYPRVVRWLPHWVPQHERNDLAQESMVRVYKALDRLPTENIYRVDKWVETITGNVAKNWLRGAKPEVIAADERLDSEPDPAPGPLDLAIEHELDPVLVNALGQLTEKQREVILLTAQGETDQTIATTMRMAEGTVRATRFQARQKLRNLLEDDAESDG